MVKQTASKAGNKPLQVEIFPHRLLQPETAERLLNEIDCVEGVNRILIQGQNLPAKVPCGPGTGTDVDHPDRRVIHVGGEAFELRVLVGRVRVEVEDEETKVRLKQACERALPFSFTFREGHFIKRKPTLTDYGKYGFKGKRSNKINLKDERVLGLVDPKAKVEGRLHYVRPANEEGESCEADIEMTK